MVRICSLTLALGGRVQHKQSSRSVIELWESLCDPPTRGIGSPRLSQAGTGTRTAVRPTPRHNTNRCQTLVTLLEQTPGALICARKGSQQTLEQALGPERGVSDSVLVFYQH
ncbi:hypothetical protein SKAU_G00251150 [Synaphobranchus kaupii]|uniref:Uncharacterized protein n=1 Tax=Synaphobranchus kaupii TaxID=118154 RepID=A0A9Q1IRW0_SYNKA|nr:hypothetical protein SKAU_G00251150 [Synaphobranchus kaupii]